MDRWRDVRLRDRSCEFPPAVVPDQRLGFDQGIDQLFQVEGIAFRPLLDKALQIRRNAPGLEQRFQHILRLREGQILEANLVVNLRKAAYLLTREKSEDRSVDTENNGRLPDI